MEDDLYKAIIGLIEDHIYLCGYDQTSELRLKILLTDIKKMVKYFE